MASLPFRGNLVVFFVFMTDMCFRADIDKGKLLGNMEKFHEYRTE